MHHRHFELAAKIALKSKSKFRLGAVLARRTKVISVGWNNMEKTHTLMEKYRRYRVSYTVGLHSEVHACLDVSRDEIIGSEIYVVRIRKDSSFGIAKPCQICTRVLHHMGVVVAYYSTEDGYGEQKL